MSEGGARGVLCIREEEILGPVRIRICARQIVIATLVYKCWGIAQLLSNWEHLPCLEDSVRVFCLWCVFWWVLNRVMNPWYQPGWSSGARKLVSLGYRLAHPPLLPKPKPLSRRRRLLWTCIIRDDFLFIPTSYKYNSLCDQLPPLSHESGIDHLETSQFNMPEEVKLISGSWAQSVEVRSRARGDMKRFVWLY